MLENYPNVLLSKDTNCLRIKITTKKRWPSLIYSFLFILLWLSFARFYREIENNSTLLIIVAIIWLLSSLSITAAFLWELLGTETLVFDDKRIIQVFAVAFLLKRTKVFMYCNIDSIEQGKDFKANSVGQLRNPLLIKSNYGCVFLRMKSDHKDAYLGIDLPLEYSTELTGIIRNRTRDLG